MRILALMMAIPAIAMASHSVEFGAFYTQHKEKGYHYDFAGITFNYEIGNSKGLKAIGRLNVSNDSHLLFLQSKNELVFYMPIGNFHLIPFLGLHATHHSVYKDPPIVGSLSKSYFPTGIGLRYAYKGFVAEFRGANLHPMSHHLIHDEGKDFFGKKYVLVKNWMVEAKFGYRLDERIIFNLLGNWTQSFSQKSYTWTGESFFTVQF